MFKKGLQNGVSLTRMLSLTGVVAAIYVVITMAIAPIAFGPIQMRLSEVLNLLVFINPVFAPGIILGCLVANLLFSPIPFDWLIGTSASVFALFFVSRAKSLLTASFWCTAFMFIISLMLMFLYIDATPTLGGFAMLTLYVMAGQFLTVTVVGVPLFRLIMRNRELMVFFSTYGPNREYVEKYTKSRAGGV